MKLKMEFQLFMELSTFTLTINKNRAYNLPVILFFLE